MSDVDIERSFTLHHLLYVLLGSNGKDHLENRELFRLQPVNDHLLLSLFEHFELFHWPLKVSLKTMHQIGHQLTVAHELVHDAFEGVHGLTEFSVQVVRNESFDIFEKRFSFIKVIVDEHGFDFQDLVCVLILIFLMLGYERPSLSSLVKVLLLVRLLELPKLGLLLLIVLGFDSIILSLDLSCLCQKFYNNLKFRRIFMKEGLYKLKNLWRAQAYFLADERD